MEKISIINLKDTLYGNQTETNINAFEELEISNLLKIKPQYLSGNMMHFKPIDFYVVDLPTIEHRLNIFEDMLLIKEISEMFADILPIISSLREISHRQEEPYSFIEYLYSVRDVQLYIDCITKLHESISNWEKQAKSCGLKDFAIYINKIFNSTAFSDVQAHLEKLDFRAKQVQSITVGINLNLEAESEIIADMGILSVNAHRFKSKKGLFETRTPNFIAPVESVIETDFLDAINSSIAKFKNLTGGFDADMKERLNINFKKAIHTALKRNLKGFEFEVAEYVKKSTEFLADLVPEISFLLAGMDFINEMLQHGMPICKPTLSVKPNSEINEFKNPHLLASITTQNIQSNNIKFDENGMIYILTGANSGGKSVFLQSVGIVQGLFQLGMYVPAKSATLSTVEHFCVHFPSKVGIEVDGGRLEQECKMISKIIHNLSEKSFILMDETFSSTSAYDASILAGATLKRFAKINAKGIFSTHIQGLEQMVNEINANEKLYGKIGSLIAVTDAGTRSYKIKQGISEGHSHAEDIARKYGLID